jgi:3-phosphoshikimate 1-carboxyvinyltransferase
MKSFSVVVKKKINKFNKSIFVPGDKSISIRYFFLASQAYGLSRAKGILESADILSSIKALTKLGVCIVKKKKTWFVWGMGLSSLKTRNNLSIDCGNSGTLSRFLLSILSTYAHRIRVYGDHTLNKRPMDRIMNPLEKIGAFFQTKKKANRTLPCYITGSEMPININHEEKIGSGQIVGGLILASLNCPGISTIKIQKNKRSRDHTERMLKFAEARIKVKKFKNYNLISIEGQKNFKAFNLSVGGDFSSASFFIVLTLLSKNSQLKIKSVNLNPTRLGALKILKKMGGKITLKNIRFQCGERIGDIIIKSSNLKPINCPASIVPFAIDEMPLIFLAASFSNGVSIFKGCRELEMKESRRLSLMNKMLNQIGIRTKLIDRDSIKIYGNPNLNLNNKTYKIQTAYDHRLSMVGIILGLTFPGGKIIVEDCNSIATSFPNFLNLVKQLGAKYEIKK